MHCCGDVRIIGIVPVKMAGHLQGVRLDMGPGYGNPRIRDAERAEAEVLCYAVVQQRDAAAAGSEPAAGTCRTTAAAAAVPAATATAAVPAATASAAGGPVHTGPAA